MHQHIDSIHSLLSLFLLAVSLSVCPLSNQLQTENLLFERKLMNVCIMKNLIINERETLPASQALFSTQPSKWTFLKYESFLKSLDKRGKHGQRKKQKKKKIWKENNSGDTITQRNNGRRPSKKTDNGVLQRFSRGPFVSAYIYYI